MDEYPVRTNMTYISSFASHEAEKHNPVLLNRPNANSVWNVRLRASESAYSFSFSVSIITPLLYQVKLLLKIYKIFHSYLDTHISSKLLI